VTDAPALEIAAQHGLTHLHSGKVRDLYRTADGRLVMVASDRISAFDFILDSPIPDKGRILTAMTVWWFEQLAGLVGALRAAAERVSLHVIFQARELTPDAEAVLSEFGVAEIAA